MKHIYLSVLLVFSSCLVFGQERILGLNTYYNGDSGGLFRTDTTFDFLEEVNHFGLGPAFSVGKLLKHSNGRIYGVCSSGGNYGLGQIYSFGQDGNDWRDEFHFGEVPDRFGRYPLGGLTEGEQGKIFGLIGSESAPYGVFQFDPKNRGYQILETFHYYDIGQSSATLLAASDGWLYGTSEKGGPSGRGTIFRVSQKMDSLELVFEFPVSNVGEPEQYLTQTATGMIYGYCLYNGDVNSREAGTIFRFDPRSRNLESVYSFPEGQNPLGHLSIDLEGNVYGATSSGGKFGLGMVFKMDSLGDSFTTLHSFGEEQQAIFGTSEISLGSDGFLYGMARTNNHGSVKLFKIGKDGLGFEILNTYTLEKNQYNYQHLLPVGSGFWSISRLYGEKNQDVFFLLDTTNGNQSVIDSRMEGSKTYCPSPGLMLGSDNTVFGITQCGGKNDLGTLFRTDYCGNNFQVLLDFDEAIKISHIESLLEGPDGFLYAAVNDGGSFGEGGIIRISPTTGEFLFTVHFQGELFHQTDVKIVLHSDGYVYGLSNRKTPSILDTFLVGIFRVKPSGQDFLVMKTREVSLRDRFFQGDLMSHSNGRLYGTISRSVFEFTPMTNELRTMPSALDGSDFILPNRIIEGPDHNLYGTGEGSYWLAGYTYDELFAWKLSPDTDSLRRFSRIQSIWSDPVIDGELTVGPDKRIYGYARSFLFGSPRPESYLGFLFSVDSSRNSFRKDLDIGVSSGRMPIGNVLFVPDGDCPPIEAPILQEESSSDDTLPPGIYPNPVSEILHIITEAETSGTVSIRDLQGRLLGTYLLDLQTGSTTIDMRSYASGTYLITISQGNSTATHKVVKW